MGVVGVVWYFPLESPGRVRNKSYNFVIVSLGSK